MLTIRCTFASYLQTKVDTKNMNTLKIEKIVSEVSLMNALETIHNNCGSHNVSFAINEVINYCQKFRNYSELNHEYIHFIQYKIFEISTNKFITMVYDYHDNNGR